MTHDELLAICDNYSFKDSAEPVKALRAVVELHKPIQVAIGGSWTPESFTQTFETQCNHCNSGGWPIAYPCQTIQAIEKELG
jgi:hypothetical protein